MYDIPRLLFADDKGTIYDHPTLKMTVRSENLITIPYELEMEIVPELVKPEYLENASPLAYNQEKAGIEVFKSGHAIFIQPPEGYLRLYLPAYQKRSDNILSPKSYTPVGWMNECFVSPITLVDNIPSPESESTGKKFHGFLKSFKKENAFKDFLLLNSDLYHTKNEEIVFPFSDETSHFTANDLTSILEHYSTIASHPILNICHNNFTEQTNPDTFLNIIEKIKSKNDKITIIYSSNLQDLLMLKKIVNSGCDCINVELMTTNSETGRIVDETVSIEHVYKSLQAVYRKNIYKSLTLHTLPGLTDRHTETESLIDFLSTFKIDLLLLKNMEIDPDIIFMNNNLKKEDIKGLKNMLKLVKKRVKNIKIGYFNRHKDHFLIEYRLPVFKRRKS